MAVQRWEPDQAEPASDALELTPDERVDQATFVGFSEWMHSAIEFATTPSWTPPS